MSRLSVTLVLLAGLTGCVTVPAPGSPERSNVEPADAGKRAQVRLELAALYLGRGQPETALGEVDRAIAAQPEMAQAHNLRGLALAGMGDSARAEQAFQRAMQLAPADGDVMHNYGWFLCQQRRWPEAEARFSAALALPQYREVVRTLLAQGVCQARAGRWADAERTLSRSYELDPGNPVTAYNLAEVLMQRGEIERARFYVARINNRPELTSAQSLWLAARIERRAGDLQAAQALGRKLQERFPESPEVLRFERGQFDE